MCTCPESRPVLVQVDDEGRGFLLEDILTKLRYATAPATHPDVSSSGGGLQVGWLAHGIPAAARPMT